MDNFIVITAPSGTGKTTLIKKYIECHKERVYFSVSHTTRRIRVSEVDGVDYYFISEDCFLKKIENDDFIEWARVHNNLYGTSFAELEKARALGKIFMLDIDVQGALNLMKKKVNAKYIFIMPPSIEELEKRLRCRGTDDDATIERRVNNAREEISKSSSFDYIVLNENLDKAYNELCYIIDGGKT